MQQIQLNIIPITPVSSKLTFAFYGDKIPNENKLFDEFPKGRAAINN